MRNAAPLLLALCAVAAAGCGGDETTFTPVVPTPTATGAAEATATATGAATATPAPDAGVTGAPGPEQQEGGAGDEEAAASEAAYTVTGSGLAPRVAEVPAFLQIALSVRNASRRTVRLGIGVAKPDQRRITVRPGQTRRLTLGGQRPGDYLIGAQRYGVAILRAR